MELKRSGRFVRLEHPVRTVVGVTLVIGVGVAIGAVSAGLTSLALPVALAVLLIGVAFLDLSIVPAIALPATLLVERVGGVLSASDLILIAATCIALLMLPGRGGLALQPLIWTGVAYLALAIPTLILNRYGANIVEWLHEIVLVLGSMVVGFVVGREGKAKTALSLYVLACTGIGIAAVFAAFAGFWSTGAFEPVYVGNLHKNLIGGALAVAIVILFARPPWFGWRVRWSVAAAVICVSGILASQSRQGIVAAMVGILIVSLRPIVRAHRRGRLLWLLYIPATIIIVLQVQEQLTSGDQFNSANQRLVWFTRSLGIWETSPVFGVGLRWWYTSKFPEGFQPPNAELEVLTTVGVVGLIGFLLMFATAAWLLARLNPVYGTLGLAVVATRFVQAQFDLYWVAGQASLLWIVAGICYGVMVRDRDAATSMPLAVAARPRPRTRAPARAPA